MADLPIDRLEQIGRDVEDALFNLRQFAADLNDLHPRPQIGREIALAITNIEQGSLWLGAAEEKL